MAEIIDPDDWPSKRSHLRLVHDNDPDYHGRPSAKELEEKKKAKKLDLTKKKAKEMKEKSSSTAEDNEEVDEINGSDRKIFYYSSGMLGAILTFGLLTGFYLRHFIYEQQVTQNSPSQVIPLYRDLDNDGFLDAYVKLKNGHKVPMYGIRSGSGDSVKYITADEMKKISFKGTDFYDSIESFLNNPQDNPSGLDGKF